MNSKTEAIFYVVRVERSETYSPGYSEKGYIPSGNKNAVSDLTDAMIYKSHKSAKKMLNHKQKYGYIGEIIAIKATCL